MPSRAATVFWGGSVGGSPTTMYTLFIIFFLINPHGRGPIVQFLHRQLAAGRAGQRRPVLAYGREKTGGSDTSPGALHFCHGSAWACTNRWALGCPAKPLGSPLVRFGTGAYPPTMDCAMGKHLFRSIERRF